MAMVFVVNMSTVMSIVTSMNIVINMTTVMITTTIIPADAKRTIRITFAAEMMRILVTDRARGILPGRIIAVITAMTLTTVVIPTSAMKPAVVKKTKSESDLCMKKVRRFCGLFVVCGISETLLLSKGCCTARHLPRLNK